MKKTVLILAALIAAAALLAAGCKKGSAAPTEGAPMELTFGYWWGTGGPFGDDPMGKYIEEKFNVKITKMMEDWSDYNDTIRIWAATDELPDLFSSYPAGAGWFDDFVRQDVIRSIPPELINKRPNVKALTDFHTLGKQLADYYGGQYFIVRPESVKGWKVASQGGLYYRRDWAEKMGIAKPTNMDEFYNYLKACVNNDPDGNGVKDTYGFTTQYLGYLFYPFGAFVEDWIYLPNGKVQPGWMDEEAMVAALGWMRRAFNEGLIDPEFPPDYTVVEAKFYQNFGAMIRSLTPEAANVIIRNFAAANPAIADPFKAVGALGSLGAKAGAEPYWNLNFETCGTLFPSDLSDEKLDKILEMYDWMLGPEGKELGHWGFKDEDYRVKADGSFEFIKSAEERQKEGKYRASEGWLYLPDWDYDYFEEDPNIPDVAKQWAINEWLNPSNAAAANVKPKINEFARFARTEESSLFTFDTHGAYIEIITGTGDVRTMYRRMIQEAKTNGLDAMVESVNKALGL